MKSISEVKVNSVFSKLVEGDGVSVVGAVTTDTTYVNLT